MEPISEILATPVETAPEIKKDPPKGRRELTVRAMKSLDRRMKQEFAKNVVKEGGNRKRAFLRTFPGSSPVTAAKVGPLLFRDPVVQEVYQNAGIDAMYLARRSKELMESDNDSVAAKMVLAVSKPLMSGPAVQRVERVSVSLFGELTDGQIQLIKEGKLLKKDVKNAAQDDGGTIEGSATA